MRMCIHACVRAQREPLRLVSWPFQVPIPALADYAPRLFVFLALMCEFEGLMDFNGRGV